MKESSGGKIEKKGNNFREAVVKVVTVSDPGGFIYVYPFWMAPFGVFCYLK